MFPASYKSNENSSYTAIDAAETFTGVWVPVIQYQTVVCACKSDVAGTLYMEFSDGGSGAAESTLTYTIKAGINAVHRLVITRPYFRVRYLNGSSNQSTFSLTSIFGHHGILSAPLRLGLGQDADAIAVRSIESELDIAEGKRSGYAIVNKFGRNAAISTADVPEDIWDGGGVYTGQPTSGAETVTITSSSDQDTLTTGTGAWTITIYGLDSSGYLQNETLNMNGTSGRTSTGTYTRVFRAVVETAGSGGSNVGTITVQHTTTTANIFAVIPVGYNRSQVACYTIPAGKTGYLRFFAIHVAKATSASIEGVIWIRPNGKAATLQRPFTATNTLDLDETIYGGLILDELTDVRLRVTSCSANNVVVTGYFDVIIVDD